MYAKLNYHVRLALFLLMVVIMHAEYTQEKADLPKTKVNATKIIKVHVDGNKLRTGKEWGHRPSSLGGIGRLLWSVSE